MFFAKSTPSNAICMFFLLFIETASVREGGRAVHPINWRSKFGGMDASLMSEMKAMAEENRRLKKMYAEMAMQNELLKDALGKK
jgi:hypothetical protein